MSADLTSSHFTSADLTSFLSLSLSLSLSCKFLFSLMVGAVATSDHEPRQSRTK